MSRRAWAACLALGMASMLACGAVHACRLPPVEQRRTAEEQLAGAQDVALARVLRAVPLGGRAVRYDFDVVRRLAGPERQALSIQGSAQPAMHRPIVTDDHDDPRFLERGGGRLVNEPDCVLRPHFAVGEVYLVFLDQPAGWRSFEHIASTNGQYDASDSWLRLVEATLASRALPDQQR